MKRPQQRCFFWPQTFFFGHENTSETGNWLQYQPFAGGKVISEDVTLDEVETTGITVQVSLVKVVSLCVCVCVCMLVDNSELPMHADRDGGARLRVHTHISTCRKTTQTYKR